ncbi:MAG TPA: cytidine deaminase [Candidatus Mediterraneibacter tabaqchaliae]|uniref:Cytidine deaminase n=1 Tax=Candidatus Mediterraneibacter tabaqchaliae TaxID=2838689 RepID=A0A9D2U3Z7_9FIRM|nr:cytidine deaminase [Lachnoclostridium sp. An76]OUN32579.1 cytidine deaminase [Lachnoclostridium sp. An76]HJD34843.1 cytidine deaminase [Candidatus Mediterraneibacter tabaqchaliae]
MLAEKEIQELISRALEARKNAYAPYSDFRVGAALLSDSGGIYTGCNIENSAYTPTNCAERTAFFKAVSEGVRSFRAICIAGGPGEREPEKPCPPCGVCRQVMLEFCGPDFEVILAVNGQQYEVYTLDRLAPMGFRL